MTVDTSASSLTVVTAEPVGVKASKLPPVLPVTVTVSVSSACTCTSSGRTLNAAVLALLAPTGRVTLWPLLSVTVSGEPLTALLSETV